MNFLPTDSEAAGPIVCLFTKFNISPSVILGIMTRKEEIKVPLFNEAVEDPFFLLSELT